MLALVSSVAAAACPSGIAYCTPTVAFSAPNVNPGANETINVSFESSVTLPNPVLIDLEIYDPTGTTKIGQSWQQNNLVKMTANTVVPAQAFTWQVPSAIAPGKYILKAGLNDTKTNALLFWNNLVGTFVVAAPVSSSSSSSSSGGSSSSSGSSSSGSTGMPYTVSWLCATGSTPPIINSAAVAGGIQYDVTGSCAPPVAQ
jgi:hypothetical protein